MKTLKQLLGFNENYIYSTMRPNGLTQTIEYQGKKIIWGLHEKGKPPTLIYPRPKIKLKAKNGTDNKHIINLKEDEIVNYNESYDFVMQRCIEKEKPEDIIKAMFDENIVFEYN